MSPLPDRRPGGGMERGAVQAKGGLRLREVGEKIFLITVRKHFHNEKEAWEDLSKLN